MKPWESEVPQVRGRAEENGLVEANAEATVRRRTPPKENSPERLVGSQPGKGAWLLPWGTGHM